MKIRTTGHAERVQLIEFHQQGFSYQQIAAETGLNYYTVRKWIRRFKREGWSGIDPHMTKRHRQGPLSQFEPMVKYVALKLKRNNPGWGLDLLLLQMSRHPRLQGMQLPSRTALYNYLQPYLHRLRVNRRPRTTRPKSDVWTTQGVHQRWQIDFKGEIEVASAGLVFPLNVCDEHSSAPLASVIYAAQGHHPKKGMTARDIQQALRHIFTRWGRPQQLRMDRDPIWVGSSRLEWPGVLLLWLVGLDIIPIINRPGRPTDNAQVERLNRTWLEHVGLSHTSASPADIQQATNQAWEDRLFHLPSHNKHCDGLPPALVFPDLFVNQRTYDPDEECALFDLQRVYDYLATWHWQRKVDITGSISLHNTNRFVNKAYYGQIVNVRFDAQAHHFIVSAMDGTQLKTFILPSITTEYITGTGSTV